jgi:hypothetical protein
MDIVVFSVLLAYAIIINNHDNDACTTIIQQMGLAALAHASSSRYRVPA